MPSDTRDQQNAAAPRRDALVSELTQRGLIQTPEGEAAFRSVPRHLFLPGVEIEKVYADEAIVTKRENGIAISSSSQPAIMAIMIEQLEPRPGDRVLEIGAATGYNAALIASIVGEGGHVVTIDIDQDLVEQAREHLAAAGISGVEAVCGDGAQGYAAGAPYDRIILSVGAWDIAPAWLAQLKPGGRLVLPLSLRGPQRSIAFDWDGEVLRSVSVQDCGFMLMRGAFAGPQGTVEIGPEPGLYVGIDDRERVNAETVYRLLTGPSVDVPLGVQVTTSEIFGGLSLWLALRDHGYCRLGAEGEAAPRQLVPPLFGWGQPVGTIALLRDGGLAALMRPPSERTEETYAGDDPAPFDLWLRGFGGDEPASRLKEQVIAWDAAGRPDSQGLRIRAYLRGASVTPAAGETIIEKRETTLVLDWQRGGPG